MKNCDAFLHSFGNIIITRMEITKKNYQKDVDAKHCHLIKNQNSFINQPLKCQGSVLENAVNIVAKY
jgi:hypothetical protein